MKPLSREFLLARGKCCKNDCKSCPYKAKEALDQIIALWRKRQKGLN